MSHGFQVSPRCAVKDKDCAEQREKRSGDPEEAHIKWTKPEVEEIAADQCPSADAVFFLEAEQCHLLSPH